MPALRPLMPGWQIATRKWDRFALGKMKPLEALAQARSHLQRALDLDETLAEAHCTLGLIKSWYDWDWDGAEREFQAALALDPSQITALIWQSLYLAAVGRHQEAIASMQRAREIEPLSPSVNLYLGLHRHTPDSTILLFGNSSRAIELDPGYYRSYLFLGRNLAWLGRYDEAIEAFQKALSLTPDNIEAIAFWEPLWQAGATASAL